MAKNNFFLNQVKQFKKQVVNLTPKIYAGIALALHRKYGWGYKRISTLFAESQDIWNESVVNNTDVVQMCEDETGISVTNSVNGNE